MKILSIGNSFSQDAHKYLYEVCKSAGVTVYAANLYIGGCNLEMHWDNLVNNAKLYDYEINGKKKCKISLPDALLKEKWDIITFQQSSPLSGIASSYIPFLPDIAKAVRLFCPDAKFYLYKTWAYAKDYEREAFKNNYDNDQHQMFVRINDCYKMAAKLIDAPVIPVGNVIQKLREKFPDHPGEFTRDGFHLSYDYGRYAAALTFCAFLFYRDVREVSFAPDGTDPALIEAIKDTVYRTVKALR